MNDYKDLAERMLNALQSAQGINEEAGVLMIHAVNAIQALQARLEVTENAPDGIACRDMTIEMLEKRIKELEAERDEREKQKPALWVMESIIETVKKLKRGSLYATAISEDGNDFPLYAAPPVTSDALNKAWADGKAEGHGDATEEASVVIGGLRARIAELEAERRVPRVRIEWEIEGGIGHGEWFPSHSRATLADYCKVMNEQYGMGSHRVVYEPSVTAPVRLTNQDFDRMYNEAGFEPNEMRESAEHMFNAIQSAVLRANGFKVDNQ